MINANNDRVLGRRGARDLTEEEIRVIQAGAGTLTACTAPNPVTGHPDGDTGECGHF